MEGIYLENRYLSKERIEDIGSYIKSINEFLLEDISEEVNSKKFDLKGLKYRGITDILHDICYNVAPVVGGIVGLEKNNETFSQYLSRLMKNKEITPSDIYSRIFMDRRLFSKIKNNEEYIPRKYNVLALAIALRLNLEESETFLRKAGYSFSDWEKFDLVIKYYIENEIYDLCEINEALDYYEQKIIGA